MIGSADCLHRARSGWRRSAEATTTSCGSSENHCSNSSTVALSRPPKSHAATITSEPGNARMMVATAEQRPRRRSFIWQMFKAQRVSNLGSPSASENRAAIVSSEGFSDSPTERNAFKVNECFIRTHSARRATNKNCRHTIPEVNGHDAMAPNSAGTPFGSSCNKNNAQRSASSASPISAATFCNASKHRKKP